MLDDAEELYTQLWPTFFAAPADARTTESVRTVTMTDPVLTEEPERGQDITEQGVRVCQNPSCGAQFRGPKRKPCPRCGWTGSRAEC